MVGPSTTNPLPDEFAERAGGFAEPGRATPDTPPAMTRPGTTGPDSHGPGSLASGQTRTADLVAEPDAPVAPVRWIAYGVLAVVLALMAYLAHRSRLLGHWWGDDWALYIRQANGLLDLDPSRVAAQNSFTVTESAGAPFSPPIYPWGYPAVLALAIPFVGDGVDELAIIGVFAVAIFAGCWFVLARRRLGEFAAIVGMVAVCFTPQIMSWTDLIQSELVFMVAVGVFLIYLDRLARNGALLASTTRVATLFGLGALAGFAFEIRREGLATVAAIGAAQLVVLIDRWRDLRRDPSIRSAFALRLSAPHIGFLSFAVGIKVFFPAVLVPRYEGAGISNVWKLWHKHVNHFADLIGLKNPYKPDPSIFGSVGAGKAVLWIWFAILAVGLILSITRWRRSEAHLAAYVVVAFVIGCSAKAALSRYFASVVPIASLLVLTTIAAAIRFLVARWKTAPTRSKLRWVLPQVLVIAVAMPMAVANVRASRNRADNATMSREAGIYQWGAQHPDAQAMFAWVRDHTVSTDVVASFKARSMVLETGRPAVQVDEYRPLNPDVDVALIVQESTSSRATQLFEDPGWVLVWSDSRLVAFAPDGSDLATRFGDRPASATNR